MNWRTIAFYASAVLVGVVLGYWLHASPAPAPSVKAAVQASRIATQHAAKAESVYVKDTSRAAYWFAKYDSVRRAPARVVVDTVTHDSIEYIPVAVADSTVHACRAVMSSCAATVDSLHGVIRAKDTEIAARDGDRPSRLRTLVTDGAIAGIAYGLGRAGVGKGLSLSLHVPF